MHLRKMPALLFLVLAPLVVRGQEAPAYTFVNGKELTVLGRAGDIQAESYHRIPPGDTTALPERVQELARNPAGINIMFQTDSRSIKVAWRLEKYRVLYNMTPLAVNGLDLYGWNGTAWQYVSSARPSDEQNSATFIENLDGRMRHYRIYLPLYTGLTAIKIGVESEAEIKPAGNDFVPSRKVVLYGSSITQGASASRPGMAYPSIISRELHVETFNMGFSGSGKMEIEMAHVIGKMDADLYVLDCVPNPSPEQIKKRALPFIKELRRLKPSVPILMVESIRRETGVWDPAIKARVTWQNKAFQEAYQQLLKEGYRQLYYIASDELMSDGLEATVDGTHPSDAGQASLARRIGQSVARILLK